MVAVLLPIVLLAALRLRGGTPNNLGLRANRLAPCPNTPNCVSTQADDPQHAIEPIRFTGPADSALKQLRRIVQRQPRTTIVSDHDRYIHAEARSRVFRFVDDLEFFVDESQQVIHFRFASRVGYSDLGVNRRRAEAIRDSFDSVVPNE